VADIDLAGGDLANQQKKFSVRPLGRARWNADPDIQALLAEINADAGSTDAFKSAYSAEKAAVLKTASFDQAALGTRGLAYEWLDQLTVELLLGVR